MFDKNAILHEAKEVFFRAMLAGYAGNKNDAAKSSDLYGYKIFEFTHGDYLIVDRYCTTPLSDYSAGTTTIFYRTMPVWWMSYAGHYPKEAIPFLKKVLAETYAANDFNGARGPAFYRDPGKGLWYHNTADGDFEEFSGVEVIRKIDADELIGLHKYQGISLL